MKTPPVPGGQPIGRIRRPRRAELLACLLPAILGLAWSLLLRPEPSTLAAPLLGPWAGHLYGHSECTMANALPGWTWTAVGLGGAALVTAFLVQTQAWRRISAVLMASWSLAWSTLALFSVLNTCE